MCISVLKPLMKKKFKKEKNSDDDIDIIGKFSVETNEAIALDGSFRQWIIRLSSEGIMKRTILFNFFFYSIWIEIYMLVFLPNMKFIWYSTAIWFVTEETSLCNKAVFELIELGYIHEKNFYVLFDLWKDYGLFNGNTSVHLKHHRNLLTLEYLLHTTLREYQMRAIVDRGISKKKRDYLSITNYFKQLSCKEMQMLNIEYNN